MMKMGLPKAVMVSDLHAWPVCVCALCCSGAIPGQPAAAVEELPVSHGIVCTVCSSAELLPLSELFGIQRTAFLGTDGGEQQGLTVCFQVGVCQRVCVFGWLEMHHCGVVPAAEYKAASSCIHVKLCCCALCCLQVFLWPVGVIFLALPFAVLTGFNPTRFVLSIYFG